MQQPPLRLLLFLEPYDFHQKDYIKRQGRKRSTVQVLCGLCMLDLLNLRDHLPVLLVHTMIILAGHLTSLCAELKENMSELACARACTRTHTHTHIHVHTYTQAHTQT